MKRAVRTLVPGLTVLMPEPKSISRVTPLNGKNGARTAWIAGDNPETAKSAIAIELEFSDGETAILHPGRIVATP